MKLTAEREKLLAPLQAVIGVVERRQTMPVLANVLLAVTPSCTWCWRNHRGISGPYPSTKIRLTYRIFYFCLSYPCMIGSYRDKRTRTFAEGKRVKSFSGFAPKAEMRLDQLDAATSLLDLDLPGNRLEALKGDRKGHTVYASTISGGFASNGRKARKAQSTSRSWTITRR
jgi:plasmid maintenance system killer protein